MDITQLILDDHHEQRRLFAILEQIDRTDTASLGAVWTRLAAFLEVHAEAEEQLFYPELLRLGRGAGGKAGPRPRPKTRSTITTRSATRSRGGDHEVGSDAWYEAVAAANEANSDHMAEEEREGLTDFRRHVGAAAAPRPGGRVRRLRGQPRHRCQPVDKDPEEYVREHRARDRGRRWRGETSAGHRSMGMGSAGMIICCAGSPRSRRGLGRDRRRGPQTSDPAAHRAYTHRLGRPGRGERSATNLGRDRAARRAASGRPGRGAGPGTTPPCPFP